MKRKIATLFSLFILAAICLFAVSCKDKDADPVAIDLAGVTVAENATLLDVMEEKKADGTLKFSISDGMIVSINGVKNGTNRYWMLYTSDGEYSNAQWGTHTYEGKELGSAVYGAGDLPVKSGEIYVWVYQKF